jgi:hypothetical protein
LTVTYVFIYESFSGGARVDAINPACTFRDKISVGDIIITVNGIRVLRVEDLSIGGERMRELVIIQRSRHVNTTPTNVIHEADDRTIRAEDRFDITRTTADSNCLLDASVANVAFTAEADGATRPVKQIDASMDTAAEEKNNCLTNNNATEEDHNNTPCTKQNDIQQMSYKDCFDRVDELKSYKEKHGHLNLTKKVDSNARKGKGSCRLDDKQIAALDAIGFNWNSGPSSTVRKSFLRVEELRAYKEKQGHLNVRCEEDSSLSDFCDNVRRSQTVIITGKDKIHTGLMMTALRPWTPSDLIGLNQLGHRRLRLLRITAAMDSTGSWELGHHLPWSLRMTGRKRRWTQKETVSLLD